MRRICIRMVCPLLLALLLCGTALGTELAAWGSVQGETAILCLPGASGETAACQVGSMEAAVDTVTPLSKLETPVETVILVDNSLSIHQEQRPVVKELIGELLANRLPGERYTIGTIADDVSYLCNGETNYTTLKGLVDNLQFQDQDTQLTDGLYHVLETLKSSDEGILRRIVLISDGVDNKHVGYTKEELTALIQSTGYPVYTIGCDNNTVNATEELQNLYALSRITTGASYALANNKMLDIVSGVATWNQSTQVKIQLPAEVCDGMTKAVRVTMGENSYTAELKMPLGAPVTPEEPEEPEEVEPPVTVPEETEPDPPEPKSNLPFIIIGAAVAAIALIAVIVVLVLHEKKKKKIVATDVRPERDVVDYPPTEIPDIDESSHTSGIFSQAKPVRLVLQNLNESSHRIEVVLNGEIRIGRDANKCQVTMTDLSVSREQCRIYQQGSWVMVQNISQNNITQVNDQPLVEPCELTTGCTLKMGRLKLRVEIAEIVTPSSGPAAGGGYAETQLLRQ